MDAEGKGSNAVLFLRMVECDEKIWVRDRNRNQKRKILLDNGNKDRTCVDISQETSFLHPIWARGM
jgi:hypothetical protein